MDYDSIPSERLVADPVDQARSRIRLLRAYDARAVSRRTAICCKDEPSITQQQFRDEVDVNTIVKRFGMGQVPPPSAAGVYGDFTGITDYASAVEKIEAARAGFMALPPEVRERFGNDPARFLSEGSQYSDEELDALTAPQAPPAASEAAPAAASAAAPPAAAPAG